jgi:hypothetical protein
MPFGLHLDDQPFTYYNVFVGLTEVPMTPNIMALQPFPVSIKAAPNKGN